MWGFSSGSSVVKHGHGAPGKDALTLLEQITGAAEGLVQQLKQLGAAAGEPDAELLDLAAKLQDLKDLAEKKLCPETMKRIKTCIEALLTAMERMCLRQKQLEDQVASLKEQVARLQQAQQQSDEDRKKVLLGELAYTPDRAVCEFVFGPGSSFLTVKEIKKMAKAGTLNDAQSERWAGFCRFIERKGWSLDLLVARALPLRKLRFEPAHGSPEERASASAEELLAWAKKYSGLEAQAAAMVEFLTHITVPGKPLVLKPDFISIMQA